MATTTVVGNIVQDLELRFTSAGKPFCGVTVAVNDRRRNRQTGEMEDGPTWFARGTLWGEFAEQVAQSVGKGSRVIGHGKIVQRDYETKAGEKRSTVEIDFDAFGPDLRFATAQVTRASQKGQGGGVQSGWHNPTPAQSSGVTEPPSAFGGGFGDADSQPF